MKIFKLRRLLKINFTEEDSVEVVKYNFAKLLNTFGFLIGTESYGISFKRRIITITTSGENRIDALKIFRKGNIFIFAEKNQLNVNWSVDLDPLYFLSFLISLVIGFATHFFFKYQLLISILTGLTAFIIINVIGIVIINSKINELNRVCLKISD